MNTLTSSQEAAIKCAFVDLAASYKAWKEMDVYSHDWDAHSQSIDDLIEAFPFLEEVKKELNITLEDEEDQDEPSFKLVDCESGSSLKGYIKTTYYDLVKCFGEPNHEGDGSYKVSFEWAIEFSDGTYATIYDWKLSASERADVRRGRLYEFHIGGFNSDAVEKVHEAMGLLGLVDRKHTCNS
jgi:hypothetical protein